MIYNHTNQHVYSARNFQTLAIAIAMHGWPTGAFAGFHQWKDSGRTVRKGEKGVPVVMFVDKAVTKEGQQEGKIKVRKVKYVFNIAQTDIVTVARSADDGAVA